MKKPGSKRLWTAVRLVVAVGLLVYLVRSGAIQWSMLSGLVRAWPLTLLALALFVFGLVLISWRLSVLMTARGFALPVGSSVRLTLIGTFFNTCLPGSGGGDLIKIYYATSGNEGHKTEVVTIMLLDRVVGLVALIAWPLLVLPFFPGFLERSPVVTALLGAGAAFLVGITIVFAAAFSPRLRASAPLVWLFQRGSLGRQLERVVDTIHDYRRTPGALVAALVITLVSHTTVVGLMLLLAVAMNPAGFAWEMSLVIPLGFMANAIPLTPGGLGVGEAAFNQLFAMVGLSGGADILVGWRVLLVLVGLIGLVLYLSGKRQFVRAASRTAAPSVRADRAAQPAGMVSGDPQAEH